MSEAERRYGDLSEEERFRALPVGRGTYTDGMVVLTYQQWLRFQKLERERDEARQRAERLKGALRAIAAGPSRGTTVMRHGQPESIDLEGSYMEDARYDYPAGCTVVGVGDVIGRVEFSPYPHVSSDAFVRDAIDRPEILQRNRGMSDLYEVGRWRFCPACGRPVANHPAGIGPQVIDGVVNPDTIDPDLSRSNFEDVVCSCCERPWIACPCSPVTEGECPGHR